VSPLPRARHLLLLTLLALTSMPLPHAQASVDVGGAIAGSGTAYALTAYEAGVPMSGVGFQRGELCSDCLIRFTLTDAQPGFTLVQDGAVTSLVPGTYEARGFAGDLSFTQNAPHDITLVLAGVGQIVRVA
jgi:hypothetical protein